MGRHERCVACPTVDKWIGGVQGNSARRVHVVREWKIPNYIDGRSREWGGGGFPKASGGLSTGGQVGTVP